MHRHPPRGFEWVKCYWVCVNWPVGKWEDFGQNEEKALERAEKGESENVDVVWWVATWRGATNPRGDWWCKKVLCKVFTFRGVDVMGNL